MTEQKAKILRMMRGAFAFSTLLYAFLAYSTQRNYGMQPLALALRRPIVIGLYTIALAIFIGALAVRGGERRAALRKDGRSESQAENRTWASFIIRMALFDAIAILGLAAAFLLRDWRLYIPAWALALVGITSAPVDDATSLVD